MKKLLIVLLTFTAIAATSCKKDLETAPTSKVEVSHDKSNVGSWD